MQTQYDYIKSTFHDVGKGVLDDILYTLRNISFTKSLYSIFSDDLLKASLNDEQKTIVRNDLKEFLATLFENITQQVCNHEHCFPFFANIMNENIEPFVLRKIQMIIDKHKSSLKNKDVCNYVLQIVVFILFFREYIYSSSNNQIMTKLTKDYSKFTCNEEIYPRGPFPLLHPFGPGVDDPAVIGCLPSLDCMILKEIPICTDAPMRSIFNMYGNAIKVARNVEEEITRNFNEVFMSIYKLYRVFIFTTNPNVKILDFKTFSVLFERIIGSCLLLKPPFKTYVPCVQTIIIRLTLSDVQSLNIAEYIDTESFLTAFV